jgi:hypothetical protein
MPNRLLCTVLEEMRECIKTLNFSYLLGLIEEAQTLASRMESRLYDMKDYDRLMEDIRDLKKKKKKLTENNDAYKDTRL